MIGLNGEPCPYLCFRWTMTALMTTPAHWFTFQLSYPSGTQYACSVFTIPTYCWSLCQFLGQTTRGLQHRQISDPFQWHNLHLGVICQSLDLNDLLAPNINEDSSLNTACQTG